MFELFKKKSIKNIDKYSEILENEIDLRMNTRYRGKSYTTDVDKKEN